MAIPHAGTGPNGKGRPPEAPPPGPGASRFSTGTGPGTGFGRFLGFGPPSTDDPVAKAAAEAVQRDWKNVEERISTLLKKTADADARYEIARIINVMPQESARHESADLLKKIKFALDALEEPAPNPETARGIIRQIEVASRKNFTGVFYPFHRLIGNTALNAILAGLLVNLLFVVVGATFFVWLTGKLTANPAIKTVTDEVIWIATFAYLGSLSSLLLKLENYAKERSYDPFLLFCTGVCKPFIGIFFGMFAYMILKSKFFAIAGMDAIASPLDPKDSMAAIKLLAMLAVIGFISGFSERFGPDLVARAESTLGGAAPPKGNHNAPHSGSPTGNKPAAGAKPAKQKNSGALAAGKKNGG